MLIRLPKTPNVLTWLSHVKKLYASWRCPLQNCAYRYLAFNTPTVGDYADVPDLAGSLLTDQSGFNPSCRFVSAGIPGLFRGVRAAIGGRRGLEIKLDFLRSLPEVQTKHQEFRRGISSNAWYWVYNVSGQNFSLSSTDPTLRTTPVALTNGATGGDFSGAWQPTACAVPPCYEARHNIPDDYFAIAPATLCYMEAVGVTGITPVRQRLQQFALISQTVGGFGPLNQAAKTGPAWALTPSFD